MEYTCIDNISLVGIPTTGRVCKALVERYYGNDGELLPVIKVIADNQQRFICDVRRFTCEEMDLV